MTTPSHFIIPDVPVWHVYPVNDWREHILEDGACWCKPVKNEDGIWIHNAMDQRELYESGERKRS